MNASSDEILELMLAGLSDHRIAARLGVSERTVQRRLTELFDRYGTGNRFLLGYAVACDRERPEIAAEGRTGCAQGKGRTAARAG
jgi:DNA-binding CsgD family transcriptional regulator